MHKRAWGCACVLATGLGLSACRNPPSSGGSHVASPTPNETRDPIESARQIALSDVPERDPVDLEIRRLQRIARVQPQKPEAWVLLGQAWVRKARETSDPGFFLNANASTDVALSLAPEDRLALALRGLVYLNAHEFRKTEALARAVLDRDHDDPVAWGILSDALLELGDIDGTRRSIQKMVEIKPNLPSYSRLSYLRWLRGDVSGAIETARLAIDAGGGARGTEPLAWMLVQAAMLFWHRGDYEGADAGFAQALAVVRDFPPALVGRGRVALARGNASGAAALFEAAYARSPLTETAWLLGDARLASGDAAGAQRAFALVEKSGQSDGRTLSLFYSVKGREPLRALELAREELNSRGDVYTLDALAWALYRNGKIAEAREATDRARRLGTPDARLLYHQGAIFMASGRQSDSFDGRKLVEEALRSNPGFDWQEATDARALLRGT